MPGWVPFTGLTLVVLGLLLALARLSQRAVEDPPALPTEDTVSTDQQDPPSDGSPGLSSNDSSELSSNGVPPADGGVTITGDSKSVEAADARATGTNREGPEPSQQADPQFTTGALLANVALTQGLFGAIVVAGAWYFEIPAQALGLSGGPVDSLSVALLVGTVFGVVLWMGNELAASVADAVGATYDETLREMLAPDSIGGWILLLGVILPIIASVEELIFRAALIGVPAAGFAVSPWLLAVLSSMAFALGHGAQGRVGIAVTGGLGFALAAGYILSESLLVVVVAHYLVNALEFLVHEGIGADRI